MTIKKNYHKTIKFLYDLQLFGIKLGLENIKAILAFLGNPEKSFLSIHIAGTNGKGSTASMIASILTAAGYKTGLYTSPHLIDFTERIRINGENIPIDRVIHYTQIIKPEIEKRKATFFEATTAIAFKYFADEKVDIAVIETGMGGRWDATNVVLPVLSVITNIEIEHVQHLGRTHTKIASEKGGIIKHGIPCLTGTTNYSALQRLRQISKLNGSPLIEVDNISSYKIHLSTLEESIIDLKVNNKKYRRLKLSLVGEYQIKNLILAIWVVNYVKENFKFIKINEKNIRKGISNISKYSGLQGRMQVVCKSPLIIVDVAHNPNGISMLVNSLKRLIVGKVITVFGVMADKEYESMISDLKQITCCMISVKPRTERSLKEIDMLNEFRVQSIKAIKGGSVKSGIRIALNESRGMRPILITGSHYVVGEALKCLEDFYNTCFLLKNHIY